MCIYYTLFIHSLLDGYWGCFHLLATGDNTAVNIGTNLYDTVNIIHAIMQLSKHIECHNTVFF